MTKRFAALDGFRLLAAALVVAIHTSPLAGFTETGDFWLTRVLARVAVPFFFMASGYFLARGQWRGTMRFLKRTLALYGAAIVLYLPLSVRNTGLSPLLWAKKLLIDGTLYHLWYFPAVILGVGIARALWRLGLPAALAVSGLLYLVGLGGDSYYGIVSQIPALKTLYDGIFTVASYTRNGLFFAPLFLLLGAAGVRLRRGVSLAGFALSLAAMSAEGLWLHGLAAQRHDSMYLALPVCMVFLFSLLLGLDQGENRTARRVSALTYVLHPWWIVLVRGGAKVLHLERLFIENSLVHFAAVLALSLLSARALYALRPMRQNARARAWRELDLAALRHNVDALRETLPDGCELMGVVKADAYGHGAAPVARALQGCGVRAFAVACLSEGVALRKAGVRGEILILGYTPPEDVSLLRRWRLTQMVVDAEHGRALAATGKRVRIHLGLDTGMHRLGIPAGDHEAIAALYRRKNLRIGGVFSHLCVVDSLAARDVAYTQEQLDRFYETIHWLQKRGYPTGKVHIQASYGVLNLPAQSCGYARVGIALYGVRSSDSPVKHDLDLRPVLSLRARVTSVRTLAAGEFAGYARAFQAERPTKLAVVSIGYADGLPRDLPERGGEVIIRGVRCPMRGRLCMDQMLVDVTALEDVAAGDTATLIGAEGGECIRAETVAQACGTISNELLSRLGQRLPVSVSRP